MNNHDIWKDKDIGEILLSIIVPVYNVEPYLVRCLSSLLKCNLQKCEILLSLGNSTDNSETICIKYKNLYRNIYIIKQNDKGLSNARNCALHKARGKYVVFIDSDDFVDSNELDNIIDNLKNSSQSTDIILTDYYRFEIQNNCMINVFQIGSFNSGKRDIHFLPIMLKKRQCFWNVWRYIYSRSFLVNNNIWFLEGRLSEDIDFTVKVFMANPQILFLHSPYYIYNTGRGNSLMDCPNLKRLSDTVFVLQQSIQHLRSSDFKYASLFISQFQFEYLLNMALIMEISPKDKKKAIEVFSQWHCILERSSDYLVTIGYFIISFLGIKNTGVILHYLKLIRRKSHQYKKKLKNTIKTIKSCS